VRLEFPKELRELIQSVDEVLEVPADYVDGPIDHIGKVKFGNSYDFGQSP
jgi:hypothetical protein